MTGDARDSEAVWRDLVAHYSVPDAAADSPAPWPDRENLPVAASTDDAPRNTDGAPGNTDGAPGSAEDPPASTEDPPASTDAPFTPDMAGAKDAALERQRADDDTEPGIAATDPPAAADPVPGVIPGPPQVRIIRAAAPLPPPPAEEDEDEHFVPPPPPPLPRLDPVSKGAWAALFGGPAYLLITVLVGWQISGIAAFIAVAAFVGGFATLVVRMEDRPPNDSGPDDGAVV